MPRIAEETYDEKIAKVDATLAKLNSPALLVQVEGVPGMDKQIARAKRKAVEEREELVTARDRAAEIAANAPALYAALVKRWSPFAKNTGMAMESSEGFGNVTLEAGGIRVYSRIADPDVSITLYKVDDATLAKVLGVLAPIFANKGNNVSVPKVKISG